MAELQPPSGSTTATRRRTAPCDWRRRTVAAAACERRDRRPTTSAQVRRLDEAAPAGSAICADRAPRGATAGLRAGGGVDLARRWVAVAAGEVREQVTVGQVDGRVLDPVQRLPGRRARSASVLGSCAAAEPRPASGALVAPSHRRPPRPAEDDQRPPTARPTTPASDRRRPASRADERRPPCRGEPPASPAAAAPIHRQGTQPRPPSTAPASGGQQTDGHPADTAGRRQRDRRGEQHRPVAAAPAARRSPPVTARRPAQRGRAARRSRRRQPAPPAQGEPAGRGGADRAPPELRRALTGLPAASPPPRSPRAPRAPCSGSPAPRRRIGVGDDARAGLHVGPALVQDGGADRDRHVHVAAGVDVADGAARRAPAGSARATR